MYPQLTSKKSDMKTRKEKRRNKGNEAFLFLFLFTHLARDAVEVHEGGEAGNDLRPVVSCDQATGRERDGGTVRGDGGDDSR